MALVNLARALDERDLLIEPPRAALAANATLGLRPDR
jgi:hypothetical protein